MMSKEQLYLDLDQGMCLIFELKLKKINLKAIFQAIIVDIFYEKCGKMQ